MKFILKLLLLLMTSGAIAQQPVRKSSVIIEVNDSIFAVIDTTIYSNGGFSVMPQFYDSIGLETRMLRDSLDAEKVIREVAQRQKVDSLTILIYEPYRESKSKKKEKIKKPKKDK